MVFTEVKAKNTVENALFFCGLATSGYLRQYERIRETCVGTVLGQCDMGETTFISTIHVPLSLKQWFAHKIRGEQSYA